MTERVKEAAGIDLPDRPGVWFREGVSWLTSPRCVFANKICGGYLEMDVRFASLPRGNWQPAVPASALVERDAEVERLKARIEWLERPGAVRIGEQA